MPSDDRRPYPWEEESMVTGPDPMALVARALLVTEAFAGSALEGSGLEPDLEGVFALQATAWVAETCMNAGQSRGLRLLLRAMEVSCASNTADWPLERERAEYYARLDEIRNTSP